MRRDLFLVGVAFAILLALPACDEPGATLEITGARALRTPEQRVAVEIDLRAGEGLGGNIGTYCTRVTFPGQKTPAEECKTDLEDGDMRTVRFVSDGALKENDPIFVRVRHAATEIGRQLTVPPPVVP